jgi:hypothetical protein
VGAKLIDGLVAIARHCWRGVHWEKGPEGPRMVRQPLFKAHLEAHLTDGPAIGLAPIVPGESVTRLALLDLDSHRGEVGWKDMVSYGRRLAQTARTQFAFKPLAFRSSGGQGLHLIFFWREPQDAYSVRYTLRELLAANALKAGTRGVKHGEVEVFPKQDEVPLDGFGSMFVLPYAGQSVLLDEYTWEPVELPRAIELIAAPPPSEPVPAPVLVTRKTARAEVPDDPEQLVVIHEFDAQTRADVRSALASMPSDDRDLWVRMGHALKPLGDPGRELWFEWSKKSAKFEDEDAERVWESLTGDRTDYRAVFAEAQRRGWVNPQKASAKAPAGFKPAPRSAGSLLKTEFKPVFFIVQGLLPEGVFLLVASPKVGKSWLTLQLALAVAAGGSVLNAKAAEGDVLVLALEDNDRRLKSRLSKLNADLLPEVAVERLHFETRWPRVDEGGAALIEQWLVAHPNARLVVVDVLERIRPARDAKANAYGEDYKALQALKAIADRRRVAIVVVHHTRKAASDDPLQLVSGTQGLAGAADGIMVLSRARGAARGELTVMGRDLETDGAFAVEFRDGRWTMLGPAGQVARSAVQGELLKALEDIGAPAGPTQIVGIVGGSRQAVQQALVRMAREGLVTREAGKYALPKDIDSLAIQEGIDVVAGVDVVDSVSTSSIVNVGDLPL